MVDVKHIRSLLKEYFQIKGKVFILPETGLVNVRGSVSLKILSNKLPVQFGTVSGKFYCAHNQLVSLEGAPTHVGANFVCTFNPLGSLQHGPRRVDGSFFCGRNNLTSLVGAPTHVGWSFFCEHDQLTSLEGAPVHVGKDFKVDYSPHLPLLRLLDASYHVNFNNHSEVPHIVKDILYKYERQGKSAALNCALELKKAGFEGNAKW